MDGNPYRRKMKKGRSGYKVKFRMNGTRSPCKLKLVRKNPSQKKKTTG
jgi:hypothetical protein